MLERACLARGVCEAMPDRQTDSTVVAVAFPSCAPEGARARTWAWA